MAFFPRPISEMG